MPQPVRICVPIEDAEVIESGLTIALSTWTEQLKRGETDAWQACAVSAYVIKKTIVSAPPDAGCRWFAVREDTVDVLHTVARACETAGAREASVLRRYADHAAAGTPRCEFVDLS